MDTLDTCIAVRCLLLADALERLDELLGEDRQEVLTAVVALVDLPADARSGIIGGETSPGTCRMSRRLAPQTT